ncbi:MAG: Fic family protein [Flavobacterium sp.]
MKYKVPNNQSQILSNKLNLKDLKKIEISEFEGFLEAEIGLTEKLTSRTKFNLKYILKIHKLSLGHLYSFAGKYRDVNMSKAGFLFASARFLPENMETFEKEVLLKLPNKYDKKEELIKDIAIVHGELLFIHPFREGNGRTARILANLMARKSGYESLDFGKIGANEFKLYVSAVQKSANKDYTEMIEIIRLIFPN